MRAATRAATGWHRSMLIASLFGKAGTFPAKHGQQSVRVDQPQVMLDLPKTKPSDPRPDIGDFFTPTSSMLHIETAPVATVELGSRTLDTLHRMTVAIEEFTAASRRIADQVAPGPGDVVGTPFVANKLGCTVVWAGEMARKGQIPRSCIVAGTGNGKPWKFYRERIEEWLNKR